MRDEEHFPEPEKFDSNRHTYQGEHKQERDLAVDDLIAPVFDFERRWVTSSTLTNNTDIEDLHFDRICPGRALAESMMWITIANVLASFDILSCKDPVTEKEIFPSIEFEGEIVK